MKKRISELSRQLVCQLIISSLLICTFWDTRWDLMGSRPVQMALFYFGSARVIRSITYGPNPRNRLDLYVPRNHWRMETGPRAVVIYITGALYLMSAIVAR